MENVYIESFNARLLDELFNGEVFCSLREAKTVIEAWEQTYSRMPRSATRHRCRRSLSRRTSVVGWATPASSANHAAIA